MVEANQAEKTLAEQIADLVQRKPQHYDVIFSVGAENVKVKAVKIILKAASPVFESDFEDKWENAVMKEGEGIPLPDIDPTVFQLFINLIIADTWSLDALRNLNLPPNTVLSLLRLCRRFKITKAVKNLEEAAADFIQNLNEFKDTTEYLEMSLDNLETVLSCDSISLDEKEIFECACRWAEHHCKRRNLELTGENFRQVLGSCFFEIRFPTMKFETFTKVSTLKKNFFTAEEKVAIYEFIGLDEDEKAKFDKTELRFATKLRNTISSYGCSVLRLPKQFQITANSPFVCDGSVTGRAFMVNQKIALHGFGFLGPIDGDTQYNVTIQIRKLGAGYWKFESETFKKNIFARKGKTFYFLLDEPITIEPKVYNNSWSSYHDYVYYSLMGAKNVPQYKGENPKDESVQIAGVEFNLHKGWNNNNPLVELLFKKI